MRRTLLLFFTLSALVACSDDTGDDNGPARDACDYHDDCGNGVCYERECYPTGTCFDRSNCRKVPVCEGDTCFCDTDINRCLPVCVTDDDCSSDGYCLDGVCTPYPAEFTGSPPAGGSRGQLEVGLGVAPLNFPVGVSMAGYGSRIGPRTPYRDTLGGSNAWFDRPDVRALAFSDGGELFVLLRIPTSWTTDFMVARTAEKVLERTGTNVLGHILTTSPHSHSHPARYWHLVVGLGFGFFGYGEFSWEIFERLTDSFADAVVMSLESLEPASFGYAVIDDFDPQNRIHRDRRERNNNLPGYMSKDGRMIVARVDDANGDPIAVLSNFGIHGTVFGGRNPVLTGDAGGGVEVVLTDRASAKYGRPVFGFFLQGNAGDISPGGDDRGHNDFERLQLIGERSWRVVEAALDTMEMSRDVPVGIVTGRVRISHDDLGYGEGEYFDRGVLCENSVGYFRYGAFQCVEGFHEDEDPATKFEDGELACVFAVECLTDGYPVPQFQKTVLSIARLGSLALVSMPGEPLSQFGRDHSDRIVDTVDGVTDATIIGYSQDHHFYLLNEDDWLQGGYEPSRDIWGWKLGPYLSDNSVKIAQELNREPAERAIDEGNLKPMYWPGTPEEKAWVELTESTGDPAGIVLDVPAQVERLDEVVLRWNGGHPGVDIPRVVLQRADGTPVTKPGGMTYDDAAFEMIVEYHGDCGRSQCNDHQWAVRWQERVDFPLGSYRFAVEGRALSGGTVGDYAFTSGTFEIVASTKLSVSDVAFDGDALVGSIVEPPLVRLVPDGDEGAMSVENSAFLMRSEEVPSRLGAPLSGDVQVTGTIRAPGGMSTPVDTTVTLSSANMTRRRLTGIDAMGVPQYTNDREYPTSRFSLAGLAGGAGDHYVELTLTDAAGNLGTITATITR